MKRNIVKIVHGFNDGFFCAAGGVAYCAIVECLNIPTWTKRILQGTIGLIVGTHIALDNVDEDVLDSLGLEEEDDDFEFVREFIKETENES